MIRFLVILFLCLPAFAQDLYVNFEGVSAGTSASLSIMGTISKTNGNAVTFSYVGTSTGISVENQTSFPGLIRPVTVAGTSYTNSSPTKALYVRPDVGGDGNLQKLMWTYAASRKVSCGFSITMTNFGSAATDFYNCGGYETGSDYGVVSMVADGSVPYIQSETIAGTGADVLIGGNGNKTLTIWVTTLWDSANDKYICAFYNQTNMALMGFSTMATTHNATVNTMGFGSTGSHTFAAGENYWLNNLILYTNGTVWPVWPGNNLQVPTNFTPTAVTRAIALMSDGDWLVFPGTNSTWTSGVTFNKNNSIVTSAIRNKWGTNETVIISDGVFDTFTVSGTLNTVSNFQVRGDLTTDESDFFHNTGYHNRYSHMYLREASTALYAEAPGLMDNCVVADNRFISRNIFGDAFYNTFYSPMNWNSTNVFCYEDNLFYWTSAKNASGSQVFMSSQEGQAFVVRHNYFELNRSSTSIQPGFDYHGDWDPNSAASARPGTMLQIYSNYFNDIIGTVSGSKFVDIRGGESLVYSNRWVGPTTFSASDGIVLREEHPEDTSPYYVTNTYIFENYHGTTGTTPMPVNDDGNVTLGVMYFTSTPTLNPIPYPHPLRNEAAAGGSIPDIGYTPAPPRIRGIRLTR